MHTELNVAVLGPGAIGGFIAAVLWRYALNVTCVARDTTAEIICRDGIHFESVLFGNYVARPRATTKLDDYPDLLFVTTKATSLVEALERVEKKYLRNAIVIPLLNGIEHVKLLRDRYGPIIAPAIISIESKYSGPNYISHVSPYARIQMASDHDIPQKKLTEIARFLSSAGIETSILSSEADVLWGKLVRLNALACTTSAYDQTIGSIRTHRHWRRQLENCVKEGCAVARLYDVELELDAIMKFIDALPTDLGTSMQRDIAAGRKPELDAITGAVIRAGIDKGLKCPTIEKTL